MSAEEQRQMEEKKRNRFKSLPVKDKLSYSSACLAFVIGWGLVIAAFFTEPTGEVHDSILWILGQALLYAGGVFGIALYTGNQVRSMRRDIKRFMRNPESVDEIMAEDDENIDG